jgi:hypothetical protein
VGSLTQCRLGCGRMRRPKVRHRAAQLEAPSDKDMWRVAQQRPGHRSNPYDSKLNTLINIRIARASSQPRLSAPRTTTC